MTTAGSDGVRDDLRAHRCNGCGLRWAGTDAVVELCGDCWRTGQFVIRRNQVEVDKADLSELMNRERWREATFLLIAKVDELYRAAPASVVNALTGALREIVNSGPLGGAWCVARAKKALGESSVTAESQGEGVVLCALAPLPAVAANELATAANAGATSVFQGATASAHNSSSSLLLSLRALSEKWRELAACYRSYRSTPYGKRIADEITTCADDLDTVVGQYEQEKDALTRTGEPDADPPPQHASTDRSKS